MGEWIIGIISRDYIGTTIGSMKDHQWGLYRDYYQGSIPPFPPKHQGQNWVAVKKLNLSYYIGETPLITTYTHYGN